VHLVDRSGRHRLTCKIRATDGYVMSCRLLHRSASHGSFARSIRLPGAGHSRVFASTTVMPTNIPGKSRRHDYWDEHIRHRPTIGYENEEDRSPRSPVRTQTG
jgi:hypothetical protein